MWVQMSSMRPIAVKYARYRQGVVGRAKRNARVASTRAVGSVSAPMGGHPIQHTA